MKSKRVDYILEKIKFYRHDGDKTKCLGFCATVEHAEFMANSFNSLLGAGTAIALSGKNSVIQRQKYLQDLENDNTQLQYIFSRDIFNEGIDVTGLNVCINTTACDSPVTAMQILGRTLRKTTTKSVVDFYDIADYGVRWLGEHAANRLEMYRTEPAFEIIQEDSSNYLDS